MWPFRRRPAEAPAADTGAEIERPPRTDWRSAAPMPVQATSLGTVDRSFEQSLATRARPLFLQMLSHHVDAAAPAGTVGGLAAPAPRQFVPAVPSLAGVGQQIVSGPAAAPAVQRAPTSDVADR